MKNFILNILNWLGIIQKDLTPIPGLKNGVDLMDGVKVNKSKLDLLKIKEILINMELYPIDTPVYYMKFSKINKGKIKGYLFDMYINDEETIFNIKYSILEESDGFIVSIHTVEHLLVSKSKKGLMDQLVNAPDT
jgi:hypothetical protein